VSGIVRALENDGRVAYAPTEPLEALGVLNAPQIAVRLDGGADRAEVTRRLAAIGVPPVQATAATTQNAGFLALLATVLRIVALTVALVCLAVLAQTLVLTARERRQTLALLRTAGAGGGALARVLGGACAAVLVPAVVAGVLLEWLVLGPAVSALAADYAGLSLAPDPGHVALAAGGLVVLGAIAVALVGRRVQAEPVVAGLRRRREARRRAARGRRAAGRLRAASRSAAARRRARRSSPRWSTATATATSSAAPASGRPIAPSSRRAAPRPGRSPASRS
jgi:hypothetical protein